MSSIIKFRADDSIGRNRQRASWRRQETSKGSLRRRPNHGMLNGASKRRARKPPRRQRRDSRTYADIAPILPAMRHPEI